MKILYGRNHETVEYAAEELKKYLAMMCDLEIGTKYCAGELPAGDAVIRLGLLGDFGLRDDDVEDAMTDDVVDIDINGLSGYIAGSNVRSVLLGVYDYLKSAGCLWVRPGAEGEFIPKKDLTTHCFTYRKKADYPFRGECIEGAVSFEHLRDTILWAPKVGMNLFMLEQVVPFNYISRWYRHEGNTAKEYEDISLEQVAEYVRRLELLIKKCGLQLHSLGHGYLLEPYGIHYKTWKDHYELTDEAREDVALVNGKRELYHGSPNFTQLCFSKDKARLGLVKFLVDYLIKKPYIDFLHVWLSDASGNQCECENCIKQRPSDFYVQMLNELDEELTRRNIETKIIFIMYIDTLWPPISARLKNPKRFIMTTAVAGRNYADPYEPKRYAKGLPAYKRNEYNIEGTFPLTLSFMDAWKPVFDGKRFLFEYYLYTTHYYDMGYFQISRLILEDIKRLSEVEFDGIMSDQTQRSYLPTALPNAVLGEGLWDKTLDFDAYSKAYFKAAFGQDWEQAYDYLENITRLFRPNQLRNNSSVVAQDTGTGTDAANDEVWRGVPAVIERLSQIRPYVESFRGTVRKNQTLCNRCHAKSWKLLDFHADLCIKTADIFIAAAEPDKERATALLGETVDWISRMEDEIAPEFDLVLYTQRMRQMIGQ